MKSLFKVSLLAATVMLAAGCQEKDTNADKKPAAEQASTVQFKSDDEKAAYAIGISFANYLSTSLEKPKEIGVDLDKDIVLKGIKDSFAGKAGMKEEEARKVLQGLDKRVAEKMKEKQSKESAKNIEAGKDFRAKFAKEDGVKETKSGLMYKVLKAGKGTSPKATDTVEVQYKGTLIDGTKFDSSYDRGEAAKFPLNRVIPGWTEGVQLMKPGAKYKFVIPPELAYGKQATPTIPANSTLVFEVELVKVDKKDDKATSKK
ncbi:FKBP-type peptidyl-prolyl cis-trans isomerase [Vibrio palustris]|uniref:Peptidyl-prolyl cis-trans isomerase n=1 Tax=Vibrio palustris TaxID=1918946 RepID=A0A1R4B8F5_9VIBR|nr:FKBP-type peptidyl-prolyl cis-trans isomerase [Vibrio palustris]SJL85200.1 FKBP-type peptidyl-prolyl cis-trans isomerase FkpA precursor [Vibrio palustris]